MDFLKIGIIEIIDIALVAILIYQLYKLVKGTVAINIFIGLAAIYLLWKLVSAIHFQLLSEILGQFIGVGVIILAIVFQQELRRFLIMIGKGKIIKNKGLLKFNFVVDADNNLNISAIVNACQDMSSTKTGAIMILTQIDDLAIFAESGVEMNASISEPMIKSIFYKNSPLHDGAVIIRENKIISARSVLPVSNSNEIPGYLGMRHRAAIGITEESDAIAIIVSEETGEVSYAKEGEFFNKITIKQLDIFLNKIFIQTQ
tara:strand:+ start:2554 stop:3330 length:777 start_codon:yes stop_codon:yes gene_type:complete